MASVPDPVFAQSLVGPGVAIDPHPEHGREARSPVAGTLVKLHPHAFVVVTSDGRGILVHLGIDTVQLRGEGFTLHVDEGDQVRAGQVLITWSPEEVAAAGRSPVVPVVALDTGAEALTASVADGDAVVAGAELFTLDV
jgi:PTS system N-acetylglucosamine-specific IIA component